MTHEQRICLRSPRNAQLITQRSLVQIQPAQRSENPWSGAIFCEPCRAPGSANEKPSEVQLIVGSANPQVDGHVALSGFSGPDTQEGFETPRATGVEHGAENGLQRGGASRKPVKARAPRSSRNH